MTAIPPLISTIPSAGPTRTAASDATDSATSFSDLLDGPAAGAAPQPRIYSFAELGMFGRHGAQALPGTPQGAARSPEPETGTAPVASAAAMAAPIPFPVVEKSAVPRIDTSYAAARAVPSPLAARQPGSPNTTDSTRDAIQPLATGRAGAVTRSDLAPERAAWKPPAVGEPMARAPEILPIAQPRADGPSLAAKPSTAAPQEPLSETNGTALSEDAVAAGVDEAQPLVRSAGEMASTPEPMEAVRPATPEGASPMQLAQPANRGTDSPNPVNLIVSGTGDDLVIVARSAGETAEESAKIRRVVEETAAEFGIDVSEFQLNGSHVESASPSAAGGKNGNRAR